MNWKDIAVWIGQFILLELSKKWPRVGDFVRNNIPAALVLVSSIVEVLEKIITGFTGIAHAADSPPSNIPVEYTGAVINNIIGTIVAENVIKKFIWRWFFGKVIGLDAAKKK